jgi:hypothetical protein
MKGKLRDVDAIIYDIEIKRCIPDRRQPNKEGLEYCAGWTDFGNMGIAVLCAFDTRTRSPRVFCEDNLGDFARLTEGRTVVGFNNEDFDDRLLAANGITVSRSYDLLCALREAVGEPRKYTYGVTAAGRSLETVSVRNLGTRKLMSGAFAPELWQQGKIGQVVDYCLDDVMKTARLVQLNEVVDPVTEAVLKLAPVPA